MGLQKLMFYNVFDTKLVFLQQLLGRGPKGPPAGAAGTCYPNAVSTFFWFGAPAASGTAAGRYVRELWNPAQGFHLEWNPKP